MTEKKRYCETNDHYFTRNRQDYIEHTCYYYCPKQADCSILRLYRLCKDYERQVMKEQIKNKILNDKINKLNKE